MDPDEKKLGRSHPDEVNPHSFQIRVEFSELRIPLSERVYVTGNGEEEGRRVA